MADFFSVRPVGATRACQLAVDFDHGLAAKIGQRVIGHFVKR
jgi:hypothetical protein